MDVVLYKGAAQQGDDIPVQSMSFRSPILHSYGELSLTIPPTSVLFDTTYIDNKNPDETFFRVDHPDLGTWIGVGVATTTDARGCQVMARDLSFWLGGRFLLSGQSFQGETAGLIFRQAVIEGLKGLSSAAVVLGTFLEAGQVDYEFKGQSVADCAADLNDLTGQEMTLTVSETGALVIGWGPPVDDPLSITLVEDLHIIGPSCSANAAERVAEVIGKGTNGVLQSVVDGGVAGGGGNRQRVVSVAATSESEIRQQAEAQLAKLSQPMIVYSGSVPRTAVATIDEVITEGGGTLGDGTMGSGTLGGGSGSEGFGVSEFGVSSFGVSGAGSSLTLTSGANLWALLREGTVASCILPTAGIETATPVLKVVARLYRDDSPYLGVDWQLIPPLTALMPDRSRALAAPGAPVVAATSDPARVLTAVVRAVKEQQAAALVAPPEIPDPTTDAGDLVTGTLDTARLGVTPGTTAASKPVVVDANKRTDEIVVGTLKLGAGAGTAVTSTAAELNKLAGTTAVTADLNKTTVAAWAAGATANPQQAAEADIAGSIGALTIAAQGSNVAAQDSTQAAIDAIQQRVDTVIDDKINAALAKLRTAGIITP